MNDARGERLQVMLSPEELAALDDFRFKHRMPTRARSRARAPEAGTDRLAVDGGNGTKSSNYGVFRRGPDGHRHGGSEPEATG